MHKATVVFAICLVLVLSSACTRKVPGESKVNFELDKWYEVNLKDGPVTLHRLRLERKGGLTKSAFFRPGNSQYLEDVQIQIEYSNQADRDWRTDFEITWRDGAGKVIDGYRGDEQLDDRKDRDLATVTLSTLRYGLEKASTLHFHFEVRPKG
ncbi:MAG: hypothetical protein ACHQQS_15535 [Thermoanaerobaculales bacterium]